MIKKKKVLFALFLVSCIFLSMSFISANENITKNISQNQDNKIVDYSQNKSFKDLDNEINNDLNKTEIILKDNYVNRDEVPSIEPCHTNAIYINHSVTIDGQGYVIDANYSSRIFHINANDVLLKNIIFKNSISNDTGAIYCNGTNITIINCTFIDNILYNKEYISNNDTRFLRYDTSTGVAINFKYDGKIINSTFTNNWLFKVDSYNIGAFNSNIHNESISLANNDDYVYDIVSFDKNHNVTIINSTFKNEPPLSPILFYPPVLSLEDNSSDKKNLIDKNNSIKVIDEKMSTNIIAKNKKINKKTKVKKYTVSLKSKYKPIKNAWVTLKVNGKIFKAKTNNKGEATFKISKLNKKGTYKATLTYKGNAQYNKTTKKVKIKIK